MQDPASRLTRSKLELPAHLLAGALCSKLAWLDRRFVVTHICRLWRRPLMLIVESVLDVKSDVCTREINISGCGLRYARKPCSSVDVSSTLGVPFFSQPGIQSFAPD